MSSLWDALGANSNNENDNNSFNGSENNNNSFDGFEEEHLPPAPLTAKQIQERKEAANAWILEDNKRREKENATRKLERIAALNERDKRIKDLEEFKEDFFLTKWTPGNNGKLDIDLPYLMANLDRLVKTVPERAKSINWDEKIILDIVRSLDDYGQDLEQSTFNGTLRQFLDDMISDKSIHTVRIPGYYGSSYYRINYSISNRTESLIRLKQILLQQGAKPKTTKLTVGFKLKLKIPEDAPYVDWAKWGTTIQDPRGRGGATRKRSKKSRKNMSRKRLY